MPPKTELPNLIFVSETRTGAMIHHSKIDDIANLIFDHFRGNVLIDKDQEPFFFFAAFVIDCTPSLHFTKRLMLFSHDEFKEVLNNIIFECVNVESCGLQELAGEIEKRTKAFKTEVMVEIKNTLTAYLEYFK